MTTAIVDESKYIQRGIPVSNGKLAMWLFLVTEIMFFTGLIGTYIVLRMSTPAGAWPQPKDVHLSELLGAINTFVLIFSSFTVVMAHSSLSRGESKKAVRYIAATFVCGWIFMGIKGYEYTAKFQHGIMPGRMADNLVDPALRTIFFRANPQTGHEEEIPTELLPEEYRPLKDERYFKHIREAGRHPYDPNVAQWYRQQVKNTLTPVAMPVLEDIQAQRSKAEQEKRPFGETERNAIIEQVRKEARNSKEKEKQLRAFELVSRINGEEGKRPITALEVGVESNELNHEFEDLHLRPFVPYGNLWSSSYFGMTGFHAVHVLGGIVVFGIILVHGLRGRLVKNSWNVSMLELTGLYWHFVDIVWIFLFPLLYLV